MIILIFIYIQCVLIIKYIVHLESAQPYINYGIAGVGQNALIMLR
jgi:hypothetical protein